MHLMKLVQYFNYYGIFISFKGIFVFFEFSLLIFSSRAKLITGVPVSVSPYSI